jgi:hypothetical protein
VAFLGFRTGIPEKSVGIGFVNPKMSAIAAIILLREFSPRPLLNRPITCIAIYQQ